MPAGRVTHTGSGVGMRADMSYGGIVGVTTGPRTATGSSSSSSGSGSFMSSGTSSIMSSGVSYISSSGSTGTSGISSSIGISGTGVDVGTGVGSGVGTGVGMDASSFRGSTTTETVMVPPASGLTSFTAVLSSHSGAMLSGSGSILIRSVLFSVKQQI